MIVLCGVLGLLAGAGGWLAFDRGRNNAKELQAVEASLKSLHIPAPMSGLRVVSFSGALLSNPIFDTAAEAGPAVDPVVQLQGVSKTARRTAALVSIGGKAADWMSPGDVRDGLTLQEVRPGAVLMLGSNGAFEVALGSSAAPQAANTASGIAAPGRIQMGPASLGPLGHDGAPAGFRAPMPPASAPIALVEKTQADPNVARSRGVYGP